MAAGEWLVGQIQLAVGGVAAKTITAPKTEALLTGQPWSEANLTAALLTLAEDVWISPTAPGKPPTPRIQLSTERHRGFTPRYWMYY